MNPISSELRSKMARVRLIALDLDGTTLRTNKTLAPETLEALKRAVSAGLEVVVATGRPYGAVASVLPELMNLPGLHYAITSNGAVVSTVPDNSRLHSFSLAPESVEQILALFPEKQTMECFIGGKPYAWEPYVKDPLSFGAPVTSAAYISATRQPVPDMRAFLREHCEELDGLDLGCKDHEEHLRLQAPLETIPGIYVTSSQDYLIEISREGCGKHLALQWLSEYLKLCPEQVAAFGDGGNDREMVEYAGLGVAMANGDPVTLAAADYIAPTNDELGVAKTIDEILKVQEK